MLNVFIEDKRNGGMEQQVTYLTSFCEWGLEDQNDNVKGPEQKIGSYKKP